MKRLVPMPGPKAPPVDKTEPNSVLVAEPLRQPPPPIVPTFRNGWPLFAWLIVTAIVMYYAKWPILLIAALVGIFKGLLWLGQRYPKTMFFILFLFRNLTRR